jgi:hypothetical protein
MLSAFLIAAGKSRQKSRLTFVDSRLALLRLLLNPRNLHFLPLR